MNEVYIRRAYTPRGGTARRWRNGTPRALLPVVARIHHLPCCVVAIVLLTFAFGFYTSVTGLAALPQAQVPTIGLFSSDEVLDLTIRAPFSTLFSDASRDPGESVTGVVSYRDPDNGRDVVLEDVEIAVRGHSSRRETECGFPKLSLRFKENDALAASLFAGVRRVKIGTHCDDKPDGSLTPYGRWANEKAAHREALVYRLVEAVGVPTFRTRPARIAYIYTDGGTDRREPVVRDAFLLEDDEEAMRRLGAQGVLAAPGAADKSSGNVVGQFQDSARHFTPSDTARLMFAEAMIGNFDWLVKSGANDEYRSAAKRGLWNVMALTRAGGGAFPLMYDFDLSGIVTGDHPWFNDVFTKDFLASGRASDVEVFAQVQRARSLLPRDVLDATRAHFLRFRQAVYAAVGNSPVDPRGRAWATAYLDAFYRSIETDAAFYVPVVAADRTVAYLDAERSRPACGGTPIPIGTPVSVREPRETGGHVAAVPLLGDQGQPLHAWLLDVAWRFAKASPARCDTIRLQPVWIDAGAIDSKYPR